MSPTRAVPVCAPDQRQLYRPHACVLLLAHAAAADPPRFRGRPKLMESSEGARFRPSCRVLATAVTVVLATGGEFKHVLAGARHYG